MTVYISGPVTGLPDDNLPAFTAVADAVDAAFHHPIVPHYFVRRGCTWEAAMRACIRIMMSADALILLPGWAESRGACLEAQIANELGIPAYLSIDDFIKAAAR
jgi:hypothetical protein